MHGQSRSRKRKSSQPQRRTDDSRAGPLSSRRLFGLSGQLPSNRGGFADATPGAQSSLTSWPRESGAHLDASAYEANVLPVDEEQLGEAIAHRINAAPAHGGGRQAEASDDAPDRPAGSLRVDDMSMDEIVHSLLADPAASAMLTTFSRPLVGIALPPTLSAPPTPSSRGQPKPDPHPQPHPHPTPTPTSRGHASAAAGTTPAGATPSVAAHEPAQRRLGSGDEAVRGTDACSHATPACGAAASSDEVRRDGDEVRRDGDEVRRDGEEVRRDSDEVRRNGDEVRRNGDVAAAIHTEQDGAVTARAGAIEGSAPSAAAPCGPTTAAFPSRVNIESFLSRLHSGRKQQ